MNGALFLYTAVQQEAGIIRNWSFAGGFISIIMLIVFFLQQNKAFRSFKTWMGFILLAVCWLMMKNYTAVVLLGLLALFGYISGKKKIIEMNSDGILYPSFPVKKISWPEVEQVVLKNGVLSIDLKNNHFFQFTLDAEAAENIDEKKFNDFCEKRRVSV